MSSAETREPYIEFTDDDVSPWQQCNWKIQSSTDVISHGIIVKRCAWSVTGRRSFGKAVSESFTGSIVLESRKPTLEFDQSIDLCRQLCPRYGGNSDEEKRGKQRHEQNSLLPFRSFHFEILPSRITDYHLTQVSFANTTMGPLLSSLNHVSRYLGC